jgi:hypothetical protein
MDLPAPVGYAVGVALVLSLTSLTLGAGHPADHQWLKGKIIDQNRARYLAMIEHSGRSSATTNGSVTGTGQSATIGESTTTNINGSYSGTSSTDYSGLDMPLYRVYENLTIEGDDMVYVTQERIRWRWSKAAQVTVNGEVKYYVDKRKLHVLDDGGKEHVIQIVKQIRKDAPASYASRPLQTLSGGPASSTSTSAVTTQAAALTGKLSVASIPDGADIEIDGSFVGNTPSDFQLAEGDHKVTVKKAGFKDWERALKVSGGSNVHLNAELEKLATP